MDVAFAVFAGCIIAVGGVLSVLVDWLEPTLPRPFMYRIRQNSPIEGRPGVAGGRIVVIDSQKQRGFGISSGAAANPEFVGNLHGYPRPIFDWAENNGKIIMCPNAQQ